MDEIWPMDENWHEDLREHYQQEQDERRRIVEEGLQTMQAAYAQSLALAAVELYPDDHEWFEHQLIALGEDVFRRIARLCEVR